MIDLKNSPLGRSIIYVDQYDRSLLFRIPRQSYHPTMPLYGVDIWNAYELSWLNYNNKPEVRMAEIIYSANSSYMVESKSLKLYLNSLHNTVFKDAATIAYVITADLEQLLETAVSVKLIPLSATIKIEEFEGNCIDNIDIECSSSMISIHSLRYDENIIISEQLYSNVLKSNCPVTHQPDFGSVQIRYTGYKIDHAGLLHYIVSFRNHEEFHEHCIERIFIDIIRTCRPTSLSVYGRYTRRGGIDINPFRSTDHDFLCVNQRLIRQ